MLILTVPSGQRPRTHVITFSIIKMLKIRITLKVSVMIKVITDKIDYEFLNNCAIL